MKLSWRGVNVMFMCTSALQFAAEGHLIAFTPLLLHDLGLSSDEVAVWSGLLFAVMTGTALPLAPFWGVLAERFSRRAVVVRAYYLLAAAMLVSAWAGDVTMLIVGRVLAGLCFGTMGVIMSTQVLITPRNRVGSAIAMVQAAQPIAVSIGPPLGALIIPSVGLRGLFVLDAVITVLAGLAVQALMPDPPRPPKRGTVLGRTGEVLGLVWTIRPVRWNFIGAFLMRGATAVIDSYLPVRITQVAADPAAAIGWILGLYGLLTTVATWVLGRIIDRSDELRLFCRSMLVGTLLTAGLAVAPWLWLVGLLAILRSFSQAFGNTLLHTNNTRVAPIEHHTAILGLAPVPRTVGGLIFPLLAALAAAAAGPTAALAVGVAGYGASFLTGLQMGRLASTTGHARAEPSRPEPESGKVETRRQT